MCLELTVSCFTCVPLHFEKKNKIHVLTCMSYLLSLCFPRSYPDNNRYLFTSLRLYSLCKLVACPPTKSIRFHPHACCFWHECYGKAKCISALFSNLPFHRCFYVSQVKRFKNKFSWRPLGGSSSEFHRELRNTNSKYPRPTKVKTKKFCCMSRPGNPAGKCISSGDK